MSDNITPENWAEIQRILKENEEEANAADGNQLASKNVPKSESTLNQAQMMRLQHFLMSSSFSNSPSSSGTSFSENFAMQKRLARDANLSPENLAAIEALLEQDEKQIDGIDNDGYSQINGNNRPNIFGNKLNRKQNGNGENNGKIDAGTFKEKNLDEFLDEMFQGRKSPADFEKKNWIKLMLVLIGEKDMEIGHWNSGEISNFARHYRQKWTQNSAKNNFDGNARDKDENKNIGGKEVCGEKNSEKYKKRILKPKLIAVVARANFLATGNKPRMAQIVALLELLLSGTKTGKLIQVSTGEGKTTIIAMHAAMLAIAGGNNETVDIVTSNKVLARRDASDKKRRTFYEMLGLNAAHNIIPRGMEISMRQKAYKADIIYGDLGAFQGDMLDGLHGENVRCGRPYANIIVDEVDSMLVDDITQSRILMLSHPMPGSDKLHCLMEMAWKFWLSLQSSLRPVHNPRENCYELRIKDPENGKELVHKFKDPNMSDLVEQWMLEAIDSADSKTRLKIPEHLKEYARSQAKNWANSIVHAFALKEGKNYKIKKDEHGFKCIKILDYRNTGTTMQQSRYSDGLHEFLEIKHELKIRKGSIVTLFSSNLEFISRYGTNIYGLTGTLGSEPAQEFLKRLYPVELISIPTFKRKRLDRLPGLLLANRGEWLEAIIKRVKQTMRQGRAILVINETVNQVNALDEELRKILSQKEANNIRIYVDEESREQKTGMENRAEPGSIILSTNLSGRGTDIVTSDRVDANGGLFVLVCFLPLNMRVQMQNFGRTARQGRPGQCQMILCRREENDQRQLYHKSWSFEDVINNRDEDEKEKLEAFEKGKLPKLRLRDRLFFEFAKVTEEMMGSMKDQMVLGMQNEELWGIKLREIDNALAGTSEAECIQMADTLINDFRNHLKQKEREVKGDFLKNSVYMLKQAQYNLGRRKHKAEDYSKVKLEETEELIRRAEKSEPEFNAYAYATHSMHDVIRSEDEFITANQDTQKSQRYRQRFIENLERAVNAVNSEVDILQGEQNVQGIGAIGTAQMDGTTFEFEASTSMANNSQQLETINTRNTRSFDSERAEQLRRRVELLLEWQQNLLENIEIARNCPPGQTIRIEKYKNDYEENEENGNKNENKSAGENNEDDDEEDVKEKAGMEEEKMDMKSSGRPPTFIIGYRKTKSSFWSGIALIVLGVIQVGLGAVALISFRPDLALTLFEEGFKDIYKGIMVAQGKDTINWGDYWREKAIKYSGTLLFSFGHFLLARFPQMQRILQLLLGKISGAQIQQMATLGLGELLQRSLKNEAVQETIERNKCHTERIANFMEYLDQNISAYISQKFGPKSTIHAKLRNLLVMDNVENIKAFAEAIEERSDSIGSFCTKFISLSAPSAADISGELEILLDQIYVNIKHKLDAFIQDILPTVQTLFEECFKNAPAWKGKEKRIVHILFRNKIILDKWICATDAAIKLQNLKLAEIEPIRRDLETWIGSFESEETRRKVESAKNYIKKLITMKFEAVLEKKAGQYRANKEDVKKLADAFKKL